MIGTVTSATMKRQLKSRLSPRSGLSDKRPYVLIVDALAAKSWYSSACLRGTSFEGWTDMPATVSMRNGFLDDRSVMNRRRLEVCESAVVATDSRLRFPIDMNTAEYSDWL